jgi:hypothetical protein
MDRDTLVRECFLTGQPALFVFAESQDNPRWPANQPPFTSIETVGQFFRGVTSPIVVVQPKDAEVGLRRSSDAQREVYERLGLPLPTPVGHLSAVAQRYEYFEADIDLYCQYCLRVANDPTAPTLYARDCHYEAQRPEQRSKVFPHPAVFADNVLRGFLKSRGDEDYDFLYLSCCKGTVTEEHVDVMQTHSWSVNVVGHKRWTFYFDDGTTRVLTQGPGQAIVVPSGLRHRVENLDALVMSLNCNWANAWNLDKLVEFIVGDYHQVVAALPETCGHADHEEVLEANSGMSLATLSQFIDTCINFYELNPGLYADPTLLAQAQQRCGEARQRLDTFLTTLQISA